MKTIKTIQWLPIIDNQSMFYLMGKSSKQPKCTCGNKMSLVGLFPDFDLKFDNLTDLIDNLPENKLIRNPYQEELYQVWYCFACEYKKGNRGFKVRDNHFHPAKPTSTSLYFERQLASMLDIFDPSLPQSMLDKKKIAKKEDFLFPGQGFYHYSIPPFNSPLCPSCNSKTHLWFALDSLFDSNLIWGNLQTFYTFKCLNNPSHYSFIID